MYFSLNPKSGNLEPSKAEFDKKELKPGVIVILRLLRKFSLLSLEEKGNKVTINNMTLINLTLLWAGPLHEARLTSYLLLIQVINWKANSRMFSE